MEEKIGGNKQKVKLQSFKSKYKEVIFFIWNRESDYNGEFMF